MDSWDVRIILSMSLFLVVVSFVFPAIGFGVTDVNSSDIPEFNVSENNLDYVDTSVDLPTRATKGTLNNTANAQDGEDLRQVYLDGDSQNGVLISLVNFNGTTNPEPEVNLIKFVSGSVEEQTTERINVSETERLKLGNDTWIVDFNNLQYKNENQSNLTILVDWEIINQPSDAGFLESISRTLKEFYLIFLAPIYNGLVTVANTFIVLAMVIGFILDLFFWLLGTYGGVVSNAPTSYAKIFMALPGLVLSLVFLKNLMPILRTILGAIPFT